MTSHGLLDVIATVVMVSGGCLTLAGVALKLVALFGKLVP